jgi:hydrogenase maturation protease
MFFINAEKVNFLIIGFGNRHRRDDGIGPYVADQLKLSLGNTGGIRILSLHQLGPELAEDLWTATGVIFIDADNGPLPGDCSWSDVRPVSGMSRNIHSLTVNTLLGMTQLIYNRCPPAWMVSVKGYDFGFGEGLSPEAADSAIRATGEIINFIMNGFVNPGQKASAFSSAGSCDPMLCTARLINNRKGLI